jgi:hypothetical protein
MEQLTGDDRLEIVELQSRFAWGLDGKDAKQFDLVFADDVEAQISTLMQLSGRKSLSRWLSAFHAPYDATQHLFSNFLITVDDQGPLLRSYVLARLVLKGHPGGDSFSSGGYYLDRLVRSDLGWRVRSREIVNLWRDGNVGLLDVGMHAVEQAKLS